MSKKKTKKKLNKKALLVILLTLYIIIMGFYYCLTLPIKQIIIKGNKVVSDKEIIEVIDNLSSDKIFKIRTSKIKSNIKNISLVKETEVRKHLNGKLEINIIENRVLFYSALDNLYILEDGSSVSNVSNKMGISSLINYVPKDIYTNLIKKMSYIKEDILTLVSEIEYAPDIKNDITIDKNRFLLRMNDGNYVYINLANFEKLNRYVDIYTTLDDTKKGVLNLDSSSDKVLFTTFEALNKEGG